MAEEKKLNEFRQDLISGDWVLFSTTRNKRPHELKPREDNFQSKEKCPFEDLSQQEIRWCYPDNEDWKVAVIKNKYPAVREGMCTPIRQDGIYSVNDAVGSHDVLIFRDHDKQLSDFSPAEMADVIRVYKKRYQEIADSDSCASYIMIFNNFGKEAGASIYHPHSQMISTPILPPHVSRSLYGARRYYKEHNARAYDTIITDVLKDRSLLVFENESFVAICRFGSKHPYGVHIYPKHGNPHFEKLSEEEEPLLGQVLSEVLRKIKKALNDPAYNFFIHTAPTEQSSGDVHEFYTWHIEVIPKISIDAGFEFGTGIEINTIDPAQAAQLLREA